MTPEEMEAKRIADEQAATIPEKDELTLAKEALAKAEEERDNYKAVALKRLGKLPGDAAFLDKEGNGELSVAEQVRLALLDREVEKNREAESQAQEKLIKENNELRLALKNRPGSSMGADSGSSGVVKDNVFSEAQLVELRKTAARLKADPEAFIAKAKENLSRRS